MNTECRYMRRHDGFTLLELLISLTILTMVVVTVFGGLRLGVRAWEKGEADLENRQSYRIVLDLIDHQIASIDPRPFSDLLGRLKGVRGDSKNLAFVSQIALAPNNRCGSVYVQYHVIENEPGSGDTLGERLVFFEKPVFSVTHNDIGGEASPGTMPMLSASANLIPLLSGVKEISFAYLRNYSADAFMWQETWDLSVDERMPRAIRVTLVRKSGEKPIELIIRLDAVREK